jgi:hypothetical protein
VNTSFLYTTSMRDRIETPLKQTINKLCEKQVVPIRDDENKQNNVELNVFANAIAL